MRPGPGLVVMALAFISGARRGTSLQISTSYQGGGQTSTAGDDNTGALARINPWLSACDLAQPNSAPDLQGQCSAGTLPMALIKEGPGPPGSAAETLECPTSCSTLRFQQQQNSKTKQENNIIKDNNNKIINMKEEENRFNNDNKQQQQQQCLDYFGDNEESSPAQLCKRSPRDIATKLRTLRLKHCCERSVISAIHNDALVDVYNGGTKCIRTLTDLIDADSLASRITCELNEILFRYDCRQLYSIKHDCRDCKEAYRRWVCSTLIPYFAEPDDIRHQNNNKSGNATTSSSTTSSTGRQNPKISQKARRSTSLSSASSASSPSSSSYTSSNSSSSSQSSTQSLKTVDDNNSRQQHTVTGLEDHEDDPVLSRLLKRSRRKSETIRKKIRPCLSVCQTVEENCPYMLPGDRAPAHPTQYAGEPTFLCLDLNIPETGDQLLKSNNGPDDCCYKYCGSVFDGMCSTCGADHFNQKTPTSRDDTIVEPETCQSLPGTTTLQSTSQQPRCITPFQASAAAAAAAAASSSSSSSSPSSSSSFSSSSSSSSLNRIASKKIYSYYYYTIVLWTISWSLLLLMKNVDALIKFYCHLKPAAGSSKSQPTATRTTKHLKRLYPELTAQKTIFKTRKTIY